MKIRRSKQVLAVVTTTALFTGLGVAAFGVDDAKEVRQADFITNLTDVRTSGHYEFLEEGLHAYTDDNSSQAKVALYYAPRGGTAIPTTASQDWYGTTPAPGGQIVFDYDGISDNGNDYNILVVESVYNGEVWLTNSSSSDAKAADPDGPGNGANSGYEYTGTLQEWKDAMPNARVLAYGFSLGSGVKGDGVLRSQTFGSNEYIFTDEENPAPSTPETHTQSAPVTATATWNNANRVARITMNSAAQPADDTGTGTKVTWEIFIAGTRYYVAKDGWGDTTTWAYKFGTAGGSVKVELKRNGVSYGVKYITTN